MVSVLQRSTQSSLISPVGGFSTAMKYTVHANFSCWWFQYCNKVHCPCLLLLVVSVLQRSTQSSLTSPVGGFSTATKYTVQSNFACWWFQYCNKGFKQPGSLNYHMKSTHNLDIPLSQGLEERYLRLKTRSAMRNLAVLEGWTSRLEQERGGTKSLYSPELPSSSYAGWSCA